MEMATSLHVVSVLFLVMLSASMVHSSVLELDDLVVNLLDDTMSVLEEERESTRYEQTTKISMTYQARVPFKKKNKRVRVLPKKNMPMQRRDEGHSLLSYDAPAPILRLVGDLSSFKESPYKRGKPSYLQDSSIL